MSFHTLPSSSSPLSDAAVQVAVRIRPVNSRQTPQQAASVCRVDPHNPHTLLLDPSSSRPSRRPLLPSDTATDFSIERHSFTFDFVYDDNEATPTPLHPSHYQQRMYSDLGSQVVSNAMAGYNCTLLAYGQTSSGKSYSMMGGPHDGDDDTAGLIPRICAALFDHIDHAPPTTSQGDSVVRKLECSYIEIYSERIHDLLDPRKRNLKVRENPKTGPYVEGVSCIAVSNYAELSSLMHSGAAQRTIAATQMNAESSRSHAVFTLQLTVTTVDEQTQLSSDVVSRVQLVDLAGSERVDTSGATGERLKEASQINKALTTLGRVIQALAARADGPQGGGGGLHHRRSTIGQYGTLTSSRRSVIGGPTHSRRESEGGFVPFRDSVLTWLLKESLGGNSRTLMLATVSPSDVNCDETLSTLRYASRAKSIVNKARVNEDPNAELIRSLKAEVDALRARLAQSEAPSSSIPSVIHYSQPDSAPYETLQEKDGQLLLMNAAIARLQSELAATSVSLVEMEAQWQGRLREAKELEELRVKEMEERGVSVKEVKDLPFLVNLNEDPALTESLIYHLHDGTTIIGNRRHSPQPPSTPDSFSPLPPPHRIHLTGTNVLDQHCCITKHSNGVVISPLPDAPHASTHVNGERLLEERALVHGDRLVVGDQHFFRFSRAKAAVEEEKGRAEEERRKRREERKRMSVITQSPPPAYAALSPPLSPSPLPDPSPIDFAYAQRELLTASHPTPKPFTPRPSSAQRPVNLNRSLNRSHLEDREPESSPEAEEDTQQQQQQPGSASAGDGEKWRVMVIGGEGGERPSTAGSLGSGRSPVTESPSPSCVKVRHGTEEKERGEGEVGGVVNGEHAPMFHLGRDVRGSTEGSSRRALLRGELDVWMRLDRRYLPRDKQRLLERAHACCVALMQPLQRWSTSEWRGVHHAAYRWRWLVIRRALRANILRLVLQCDEANAIASALGRVERYKVELSSSHCVLPESLLSFVPFDAACGAAQGSPLQRLRALKVVFSQVVEVRRRMLPIPVLSFDADKFHEQLTALRTLYTDTIDAPTPSPTSLPPPLPSLPSSSLYLAPQLLGRAFCFLHPLRYGHVVPYLATVLDERGEIAGRLGVELELCSVDEEVARREISAEERQRAREEREDEARRKLREVIDHDDDAEEDDISSPYPHSPREEETKTAEDGSAFLSAHRTLAVVVRLTHFDAQARQLRRHGLQSFWLKYRMVDASVAYRSRKVGVMDEASRFQVGYEKTHYVSGVELQMMRDWLEHDALVVEVWCRVEDPNRAVGGVGEKAGKEGIVGQEEQDRQGEGERVEEEDAGRREALAKRMQGGSPNKSVRDGERREATTTERSTLSSRASLMSSPQIGHQRRATWGGAGAGAAQVGGGRMEEDKVEIEDGNRLVDHLLFACVDVEEGGAAGKRGGGQHFTPCSLKQEDDGRLIHRVTISRGKRLVVSLLQADHRPFVLESIRSVTCTAISVRGAVPSTRLCPPLASPVVFPIVEQFAKAEHKLLMCVAAWPRGLDEHAAMGQASAAGERVVVELQVECWASETTVPVVVPVQVGLKVYKGGGGGEKMWGRLGGGSAVAAEGERWARLGGVVAVTRQTSPATVLNVLREGELVVEQLQRRLRAEQATQLQALLRRLEEGGREGAATECRLGYERGADGLCRHFPLRLYRVLADLRERAALRVEVERVGEEGVRCGYLNERGKGGQWEPKWCVLKPPYLFVYARRAERREQAIVKLIRADFIRGGGGGGGGGGGKGGDASFSIRCSNGAVFGLQAASEAEMRSWLRALGAPATS